MRRLPALLAAVALALAACGGDDEGSTPGETTATAEAPVTGAEQAGCERVQAPEPKGEQHLSPPKDELSASRAYVATVLTSCGSFEITLDAERAPRTGASFKSLADQGFYDGLTFHRVVQGFVIQGGDPLGTGEGGPGYSIVEKPPSDLAYTKGVVAMAKTAVDEPGTSGSQFFVVTGEDAGLEPDYALLGTVTKGMDVVERIGVVEVDGQDKPVDPVLIRQIQVRSQ